MKGIVLETSLLLGGGGFLEDMTAPSSQKCPLELSGCFKLCPDPDLEGVKNESEVSGVRVWRGSKLPGLGMQRDTSLGGKLQRETSLALALSD